MNKTVTVNISGIIFNIDEEAYAKLQQYLDKIRGYFKSSDGRDEIMADIEARIAELFQEKITDRKEVIGMNDVDEVIAAMGQPEDYLDEEELEAQEAATSTGSRKRKGKRLYRDPDDRVLGGVCAGLSHYLGIDAVWIRILFIALKRVYLNQNCIELIFIQCHVHLKIDILLTKIFLGMLFHQKRAGVQCTNLFINLFIFYHKLAYIYLVI